FNSQVIPGVALWSDLFLNTGAGGGRHRTQGTWQSSPLIPPPYFRTVPMPYLPSSATGRMTSNGLRWNWQDCGSSPNEPAFPPLLQSALLGSPAGASSFWSRSPPFYPHPPPPPQSPPP